MFVRKFILSGFLFAIAFLCCSANRHMQTSASTVRNQIIITFQDKSLKIKLNAHGTEIKKFNNGKLKELSFYQVDKFYQVFFYPHHRLGKEQARLIKEYTIANTGELLDGSTYCFNEEGEILSEANWSQGKLQGKQRRFNQDGQIVEEKEYMDGLPVGEWSVYYSTGKIASKTIFPQSSDMWKETIPYTADKSRATSSLYSQAFHKSLRATETWYSEYGKVQKEQHYRVHYTDNGIVMKPIR
jgi:antitoxin component YwqK of YwqJK toxin-antitoxin module